MDKLLEYVINKETIWAVFFTALFIFYIRDGLRREKALTDTLKDNQEIIKNNQVVVKNLSESLCNNEEIKIDVKKILIRMEE